MKKNKLTIRIIMAGVLAIGLLYSDAGNAQESDAAKEDKKPFVYDDMGKRDPFWQLVSPSGVINNFETDFLITDLFLEGTMASPDGGGMAIINGQILKKGQQIGQFTLQRIDKASVTLMKGNQVFKLYLKKEE